MRQRQSEIHARLDESQAEKRDIAKQVFEEWYGELQPVVKSAEHGLFIVLLEGLEPSFYSFQEVVAWEG